MPTMILELSETKLWATGALIAVVVCTRVWTSLRNRYILAGFVRVFPSEAVANQTRTNHIVSGAGRRFADRNRFSQLITFQSEPPTLDYLTPIILLHLQFYSIDQLVCRFIRTVIFYHSICAVS
jgi:uncharacterized membrane protein (GlpM family)